MICSPCTRAFDIYLCSDTLEIGDVAASGDYHVVIQNNTTGRITIVPVTLAVAGTVSVDMDYFAKDHNYTIAIQRNNLNVVFTIDTTEVSCVDFIVRTATVGAEAEQKLTLPA